MQDEVRDKSVALAIKVGKTGGRLTADLLKWAIRKYLVCGRFPHDRCVLTEALPSWHQDFIWPVKPWPQQKGNVRKSRPNQGRRLDYPTMSVEDCFKMQDPFFEQANEQHNIFIWTIDKFLLETCTKSAMPGPR